MQFHDKLLKLRKKAGMTQSELAEAVNVSRQAVSKWEMGTAVPDVENLILLGKLFSVSIDYLVNESMASEFDNPIIKATSGVYKITLSYILVRVTLVIAVILIAGTVGMVTKSSVSVLLILSVMCFFVLIYYVVRLLFIYLSNQKR
ncbi:MAG: XRE family transcriptional regulator [Negativicutes bacterium]|nr:XRE family transcriptional regulator [Negativicutes bacterium]